MSQGTNEREILGKLTPEELDVCIMRSIEAGRAKRSGILSNEVKTGLVKNVNMESEEKIEGVIGRIVKTIIRR